MIAKTANTKYGFYLFFSFISFLQIFSQFFYNCASKGECRDTIVHASASFLPIICGENNELKNSTNPELFFLIYIIYINNINRLIHQLINLSIIIYFIIFNGVQ